MVTTTQLKKQIASQKAKLAEVARKRKLALEKQSLQLELIRLRNQGKINFAKKGGRIIKRSGQFLAKQVKRAAPLVQKQGRLIREQQLRDDALERRATRIAKKRPKVKSRKKRKGSSLKPSAVDVGSVGEGIFQSLDF